MIYLLGVVAWPSSQTIVGMFPDFESGAYKREAETSVTLDKFFCQRRHREEEGRHRENYPHLLHSLDQTHFIAPGLFIL